MAPAAHVCIHQGEFLAESSPARTSLTPLQSTTMTTCGLACAQYWGTPAAPDLARVISTLSLSVGGLGLASAQRSKGGAHWASWADCIRMVKERHPTNAETMITHMADGTAPCFEAVRACELSLVTAGLEIPSWRELAETPPERVAEPEPNQPKFWVATEGHPTIAAAIH